MNVFYRDMWAKGVKRNWTAVKQGVKMMVDALTQVKYMRTSASVLQASQEPTAKQVIVSMVTVHISSDALRHLSWHQHREMGLGHIYIYLCVLKIITVS